MTSSTRGVATRRFVPVLLTFVALVVVACGTASMGAGAAPSAAANGGGNFYGGTADNPAGQPAASAAPAAPGAQGEQPEGQGGDDAAFQDGAKIVRNGSMQLEVADVPKALASARSSILGVGGYIGASQQYRDGDDVVATVEYRIPVDRWEDALDSLRRLGSEVGEQTDSADVTSQLVDLDARIRNLRASETALVGYLKNATRIEDMLDIEGRLTNVRSQIEQLAAQKASLDDRVAYATLAVTFGVSVAPIQVAAESWDPGSEVNNAGATLLGFLQALATVGIWFGIVWLPILAVLGVVVGAVYVVGRRLGWFRRPSNAPPIPPLPPAPAAG